MKGFAAAQDELGLAPGNHQQPHLHGLKPRFGVRLCERGRKGFSLTPDGVRILEAAETLLRSVENFTGIVGSVKGELSGTVHLGTVDAMHTNRRRAARTRPSPASTTRRRRCMLHVEIASPQESAAATARRALWRDPDADRGASSLDRRAAAVPGGAAALLRPRPPLFGARHRRSAAAVRQYPYVGRSYMQEAVQSHDEVFDHRAMTSHMEAIAILIKSGRFLGYLPDHFARSFVEAGEMRSLLDRNLPISTRSISPSAATNGTGPHSC